MKDIKIDFNECKVVIDRLIEMEEQSCSTIEKIKYIEEMFFFITPKNRNRLIKEATKRYYKRLKKQLLRG